MFKILFDRDTWQEIFGSIQKNRLRTIVTIVGVLWGILIYITLSGAAKGLDNGFDRQFQNVAINSMFYGRKVQACHMAVLRRDETCNLNGGRKVYV